MKKFFHLSSWDFLIYNFVIKAKNLKLKISVLITNFVNVRFKIIAFY